MFCKLAQQLRENQRAIPRDKQSLSNPLQTPLTRNHTQLGEDHTLPRCHCLGIIKSVIPGSGLLQAAMKPERSVATPPAQLFLSSIWPHQYQY
jgi:hypothetical protein